MKIPLDIIVGSTHSTKSYGNLRVIDYINARCIKVEFLNTGYTTYAEAVNIRRGAVKDRMHPYVCGVGFIGLGSAELSINGKQTKSYKTWHNMIFRCYSECSDARYPTYIGCEVDKEWHSFNNFDTWYREHYKHDFELDKDIKVHGNKIYGPDTCMFVSGKDNTIKARAKYYRVKSPAGVYFEIYNMSQFCRDNGIDQSAMISVVNGKANHHKGWKK